MSKKILCYGDSNTWGSNAETKGRFPGHIRWTGVLKNLKPDYEIIEEGLGGRTTVWDDPIEGYKNGKTYLIPCLQSHSPIDLVIIMLGTNDLKKRFSLSAYDIAAGAGELVRVCQSHHKGVQMVPPKVLLISPIHVGNDISTSELNEMFGYENSIKVSQKFGTYFKKVADEYGCEFLDASEIITATPIDSIHIDESGHYDLATAIADKITEIYEETSDHEAIKNG